MMVFYKMYSIWYWSRKFTIIIYWFRWAEVDNCDIVYVVCSYRKVDVNRVFVGWDGFFALSFIADA
jgi:hypothetical protein